MKNLHRNVPILSISTALMMSCNSLLVATSALVGYNLAEDKSFATLPMAAQFLAIMLTSIPAAMLMQRIGRKAAFQFSMVFGVAGACLASYGIFQESFWLFVMGAALMGIVNGFSNYYRFSAADSVDIAYKSKAISLVMIGGVFAAVLGPNLAKYSREWIQGAEFSASYLSIIVVYIVNLFVLTLVSIPHKKSTDQLQVNKIPAASTGRKLSSLVKQPKYIVAVICGMLGFGVMSFVMTATPLSMSQHAFIFDDTAIVIQWHVMAMFAPSFFTGNLIVRFGLLKILTAGALLGMACVVVNLLGTSFYHFITGLVLLGVSWNFLFVGATTLLTETYRPEEKNKAQAVNDFIVFSTVALASLTAGALQNSFGWQIVNLSVVPLLAVVLFSIAWLKYKLSLIEK